MVLLVTVMGGFGYWLFSNYGKREEREMEKIKFEPRTWNNAVRNVPVTEYGQTPQIETGDSIQGFSSRTGTSAF